ncbi:hypothetical protein [Aeromicrobium sp. CF3.5]|uniref:hypothetical protein n=1 Tax=Aeromicrobium sp. CF3.5 TaxID=3373078 RepID=UPI003EE7F608
MPEQEPPKKVVKRVVKRAVVQPPAMRYGRPAPAPKQTLSAPRSPAPTTVADHVEPTPSPPVPAAKIGAKRFTVKRPRLSAPPVDLGSIRDRTAQVASGVTATTRTLSRTSANVVIDRWYDLRTWWLPTLEPMRASAITGLLMGLLAVGLGVGALAIFSQVRGVASGGGTWGSLTFVVVAFVAFAIGERLLAGFGAPMPRLTSFLGITLTLVAILGLFLGIADSTFAIVVVPLVSAAGFLAAHWLLALAESAPPELE